MYYNPKTNEIKTRKELMEEFNMFFPIDAEIIEQYHRVYKDEKPVATTFHTITENPIEVIDGVYKITYSISFKPIEEMKTIRYNEVETYFKKASEDAWVISTCGFKINAGDVANRDVEGLIKVMKADGNEYELFRDYDNNFHKVTLNDLETMQLEIIKNGQNLYKQKWNFLNEISSMSEPQEVFSYSIIYNNLDFLNDNK